MMRGVLLNVKRYLARPESGAGLMYAALALVIVKLWLTRLVGVAGFDRDFPLAWTVLSFLIAVWLAFVLLRLRLSMRALRRILLLAAVHAVGAIRFYDWGLMLLSVLPLFALAPAVLLAVPARKS